MSALELLICYFTILIVRVYLVHYTNGLLIIPHVHGHLSPFQVNIFLKLQ